MSYLNPRSMEGQEEARPLMEDEKFAFGWIFEVWPGPDIGSECRTIMTCRKELKYMVAEVDTSVIQGSQTWELSEQETF